MLKVINILGKLFMTAAALILILVAAVYLIPFIFGYKPYAVLTGSMSDVFPAGSLIYIRQAAFEELDSGDIITYTDGGITVTHRITEKDINNKTVKTKGDRNNADDGTTAYSEIIGKAANFSLPYMGGLLSSVIEKKAAVISVIIFIFLSDSLLRHFFCRTE